MMTIIPKIIWNSITISPKIIIKIRTAAPTKREIVLSKNARIWSPIDPDTLPADICLNGAKIVETNWPTEKKSAEDSRRSFIVCICSTQPFLYHQDNMPTKNMSIL